MLELLLAMLAGALLMDVAVEAFRIWERAQQRRRDEASRARIRRELRSRPERSSHADPPV